MIKGVNNFFLCVGLVLFITCFIFIAIKIDINSNLVASPEYKKNKDVDISIQDSLSIPIQQRDIKNGLKRIEKKLIRNKNKKKPLRKTNNANKSI